MSSRENQRQQRTSKEPLGKALKFSNKIIFLCIIGLTVTCVVSEDDTLNDDKDVIDRVTGHFYLVHDRQEGAKKLSKRDVQAIRRSQKVRLDLGPAYRSVEMTLSPGTVWTPDSAAFHRLGTATEVIQAPVQIDPDCFFGGLLSSHEGAASFCHCNGLRGFVQTPNVEYIVEQSRRNNSLFSEVSVILMKPSSNGVTDVSDNINNKNNNNDINNSIIDEDGSHLGSTYFNEDEEDTTIEDSNENAGDTSNDDDEVPDDDDIGAMLEEESIFFNQTSDDDNDSEETTGGVVARRRRATPVRPVQAEIAVYVDRNMANYLKKQGMDTTQKVTEFMVTKWNAIARVYGNVKQVGVSLDIQLKRVEVWWENPAFYKPVQKNENLGRHLSVFCNNTRSDRADHRMLYTHGVGGRILGIAWVGSICNSKRACSVVRSRKRGTVLTELHELGHNLGFRHDPQMDCAKPYGFMGWRNSRFHDCYKKRLLNTIKRKSARCLRQRNVRKPKLNKGFTLKTKL